MCPNKTNRVAFTPDGDIYLCEECRLNSHKSWNKVVISKFGWGQCECDHPKHDAKNNA